MAGLIKEEQRGRLAIVTIDRPERRNAVDLATARALYERPGYVERRSSTAT